MVGILPLFAVDVLPVEVFEGLPDFSRRVEWFEANRTRLAASLVSRQHGPRGDEPAERLLAMVDKERLVTILRRVLDEAEFLSPHGVRSLSRAHRERPFELKVGGELHRVAYVPGESDSPLFGGNSNWRGPVWMPLNYLLLDALERYHDFYGPELTVECPTGSGVFLNLAEVSKEIARRLVGLFRADAAGRRPWHGDLEIFRTRPELRGLQLFHEYFDGDTGRGMGASHQTGWTALITRFVKKRLREM